MNEKKRNKTLLFCVLLCVLTAACLYKISALKRQMEEMRSSLEGRLSSIQAEVGNIYSQVDWRLSQQENLLTDSGYELGEADYDEKTASLLYWVTPKEYSPSDTRAVLLCGGKEYPMELENGSFKVRLSAPLLEEIRVDSVQFYENGLIRTQPLDVCLNLRQEYFDIVFANYLGEGTLKKEDGQSIMAYDGAVEMTVERNRRNQEIKSILLCAYVDGKEISSKNLCADPLEETAGEKSEMGPAREVSGDGKTEYLKCAFTEKYSIPFGSTFELVTDVTMEDGLIYRNVIRREVFDGNGEPKEGESAEDLLWMGMEASILDSEGRMLFDSLEEAKRLNQER